MCQLTFDNLEIPDTKWPTNKNVQFKLTISSYTLCHKCNSSSAARQLGSEQHSFIVELQCSNRRMSTITTIILDHCIYSRNFILCHLECIASHIRACHIQLHSATISSENNRPLNSRWRIGSLQVVSKHTNGLL